MSKYFFLKIYLILFTSGFVSAQLKPTALKCEYLENPPVVDVTNPRLSWTNVAKFDDKGQQQTAWEIRVSSSREKLKDQADLWKSSKVSSDQSFNISYAGKPLSSRQYCWWQVRTWDKYDKVSTWSEPASWSMGLLKPEEWRAQWIGAPWQGEDALAKPPRGNPANSQPPPPPVMPPPAPMLRKSFAINKTIKAARAYVTGLGFFEFYVNGNKVSDDVLVPNLTAYGKRPGLEKNYISVPDNFREYRVMYLSYDVKDLLQKGNNAIGAMLGNGFYNAPINWTHSYGTPRFLGQVCITYEDGSEEIIVSDTSWKAAKSPIVMDLVYDGEHYDARLEQDGWSAPGFDDSKWEQVIRRKTPEGKMKAHMSPTDRVMEKLKPAKIESLGNGKFKVDFGQEISGWLHLINVKGEAGQKIEIKYISESHVGDNSYTLRGAGKAESYAPRFTWFVFREVEITNWPGDLNAENLLAEAVYSNVKTTGKFETSNTLFNNINKIWWRSQTDNMHGGIASDCPHRERSPYTGDGQVACVTVMHNFDARAFYTKWIQDIHGAQNPETGYVPNCAPWQPGCGGGVAWGAAMNIMPWEFYLHYGDVDMLKDSYEGMKGYVKYMLTWTDKDGIMFSQAPDPTKPNRWLNLGDWASTGQDKLPPDKMVHTFYLWRCADLTAQAAKVLGKDSEAQEFKKLAEKTRSAFHMTFYDQGKGSYGPYGGNIFALRMGVPPEQHARVVAALKSDIVASGGHLDTGIFGTQFFFEVLSENGLHDLAFEAMNKKTQPSFGWWIEQGATTSWEHWDEEGSHNHPMFGGGIVWFYRILAGMNTDPNQPGYRHIIFRPQPAGDVTFASYANETPYGIAGINWKKNVSTFSMDVAVPVGSTATVYVPAANASDVTEVGKKNNRNAGARFESMENGYAVFSVNSGNYSFESKQ